MAFGDPDAPGNGGGRNGGRGDGGDRQSRGRETREAEREAARTGGDGGARAVQEAQRNARSRQNAGFQTGTFGLSPGQAGIAEKGGIGAQTEGLGTGGEAMGFMERVFGIKPEAFDIEEFLKPTPIKIVEKFMDWNAERWNAMTPEEQQASRAAQAQTQARIDAENEASKGDVTDRAAPEAPPEEPAAPTDPLDPFRPETPEDGTGTPTEGATHDASWLARLRGDLEGASQRIAQLGTY